MRDRERNRPGEPGVGDMGLKGQIEQAAKASRRIYSWQINRLNNRASEPNCEYFYHVSMSSTSET